MQLGAAVRCGVRIASLFILASGKSIDAKAYKYKNV